MSSYNQLAGYKISDRFSGRVHIALDSITYASRRNMIFARPRGHNTWEKLCSIPLPAVKKVLGRSRLIRRLLRCHVLHIAVLDNQELLIFAYGRIFTFDRERNSLMDRGMMHGKPLTLCMGKKIYYGEYVNNPARGPVHVWMSDDMGATWKAAWRFEGIRHIHGISRDPFTEDIWVTTGDVRDECGIWVTRDNFRTMEKVFGGDTQNTAIQLLFAKDNIYFGTDAPFLDNYICRIDRETHRREEIQKVEGPIYYGTMAGNKLFFSTVCEKGNGLIPKKVALWHSCDGNSWKKLFELEKDVWPLRYFQFGNILFPPSSPDNDHLWISPVATDYDQVSLKLDIRECCS